VAVPIFGIFSGNGPSSSVVKEKDDGPLARERRRDRRITSSGIETGGGPVEILPPLEI